MTLEEWEIELDNSGWEPEYQPGKIQLLSYIADLKRGLDGTDYMVIKCYEAQLAGIDMPYDLQKLLTLRNTWRNKISEIEFQVSMLS